MHTSTFWTAGLRCVLVFWVATCVGAARGHAADTNPPSFTLQPTNTTVLVGSNATFSALAAGTTPISYQWYHGSLLPGDVPLSGATSNGLTFAASETNTGPYYVAASNSFGLSTSAVAILTLRYAPVAITSQPADKTVTNGATVSFTVTVTGSKPQYQWFLGDTPLVNATNATLTLSNVTLGQMGYYQAMIWNVTNTVWSRSALLLVSRPPVAVMGTNQIWYFNDTGADLGTAWTAPVYSPASTWSNGPALLGFKCDASLNYQATDPNVAYGFQTFRTRMNRLSSFAGTNNITYYLRTTFTNDGTWLAPAASLVFSNLIDDGAVVYLNGMEINRSNMPSGPISYQTLASSAVNADHWIVNPVPVNLLLPGVNVLAVELHQASVSSADVDWLSLLTCTYATPTLLTFSNQPASLTVHEAENPLFSAGVSGPSSPLWTEYQWYKLAGGIPQAIPGATGSNLQITNVRFGVDGGDYFVTVSNPICYLVSSLAHLEVLVDTNPPVLLQADGTQSATNLQLLFSEAITAATATNLAGYAVQASTGESVTILSVTQTSPSNVVLITTPRAGGLNWIVQVSGMRDLSPAGNVIAPNSGLPITTLLKLAALDDPWTIANPVPGLDAPIEGNTWRGLDYVPTPDKWATRRAPFAISGRFPEEYPWPVNSKLSRGLTQACFRRELNPLASPAGARLLGNVYVMGGAAVFLNGTELARTNLAGENFRRPTWLWPN